MGPYSGRRGRRLFSSPSSALRLILREYDLHRGEGQFTAAILRALSLNSRDDLVRWAQNADKMEIATLAPVVFEAATNGDANVVKIIEEGAAVLSEYTEAVATRLQLLAPKVVLLGGLFQRDSVYTHTFRRRLKKTNARRAGCDQRTIARARRRLARRGDG